MSATNVRALAFDLYGTLLDVRSIEAASSELTSDPMAFVGLWRQKQLEYTWLRALTGHYEDFWAVTAAALEHAADRLGLELDDATRSSLLQSWLALRPYPDVPDALRRLRRRPLALLSNGTPRMLEEGLRAARLRDRFAHVLSVDDVKTYKPAPAVYELAERAFGLPREEVLFVSANAWDAAGAKSFGLPVAWLNRTGVPWERLGVQPDIEVADLTELADRLGPG